MNLKKWKELNNIPKGENNRNYFTKEQLEHIQKLETKIADIIEFNSSFIDEKELYGQVKQFIDSIIIN